jgi:YbbR domain-containing protein
VRNKQLLVTIFRNFQYKISALILACLFWYIVQGEEILEVNRRIAVNIKVADGYMVKGSEVRMKDATIRGPRVLLGDFSTRPLEAVLRVQPGRKGQLRFRIDKEHIRNWDNRLRLTVHDPYVTVLVDAMGSRKVAVKENIRGVPADGYIVEKVTLKPNVVTITGLQSEINRITEVVTEPIDLDGLQQSKSFEANLVAKDFPKTSLSTDKVTVSLLIGEKKINRRFGSVPVQVVGSDYLSSVKPRYVSIVIQGTPGVLSFVKRSDLEAFVEARELEPGKKYNREIQAKIPPDTVLIETFPQKAAVEIYNQKRL